MSKTAIDLAYDAIRKGIYQRKYLPGHHIKEEDFSEALKISRTPVRQAIRMLASEGLIDIKDNKRSYVTNVGEEDIETLFDIVSMLESYSAGLAAENITAEGIAKLKRIQDHLEAGRVDDDRYFLEANSEFHRAIHAVSGSRLLRKLISQVVNLPMLYYMKAGMHTENETAAHHHREIIEAMEIGDSDYAALKMKVHMETVRLQYREIIEAASTE